MRRLSNSNFANKLFLLIRSSNNHLITYLRTMIPSTNICGLWLFEQSRKEFKGAPASVGELVALCEQSDYDGLIFPDAPCFAAPASMTAAIREYCLSTGQAAPETPADYCRCIFRSLALRYRQVVEILQSMCDFPIRKLHVIGGGSQNKYLMQYAANALNMTVICGPIEGTALGNVLMQIKAGDSSLTLDKMREISAAAVELKTFLPADTEVWNKAYEKFINLK